MKHDLLYSMTAFSLLLTGCGCQAESSSVTDSITDSSTNITSATTQVTESTMETTFTTPSGSINPLTGEGDYNPEAVGKRPVAVMVNNVAVSLPQYGIAAADLIFEIPVEAGITRLMAIYADYTAVPAICSVRSCRYYYPLIAHGYDAIYCHWGSDQTIAMDTLKRLQIDRLDGAGKAWQKCYFRDADRLNDYAVEHTGYLDGAVLPDTIRAFGFRTETPRQTAFSFRSSENPVAEGDTCQQAVLHFSGQYTSGFSYDDAGKVYYKTHNSNPHMDSGTGTQLAFTNVFVLQTEIQTRADGYLMDVDLAGGEGWYLSAGARQAITWEKTADDAPISVYNAMGEPLSVNIGNSYIGIIDADREIEWN